MSTENNSKGQFVRIDLTETQKEQVKHATGKDAESIELDAEELEQRISPRVMM